jgi:hypothetical protein
MAIFDDNVDALEVVEDHAKEVLALETRQANKVISVYADVVKTLRQRLRSVPKDSFSAQQIRVTLMQLQGAIDALHGDLSDTIDIGATLMAKRGIRDLVEEVRTFNDEFNGAVQPVRLDLVQQAIETKSRLINQYQASIDAYSKGLRQTISDGLMNMVVERVGPEVMYQRLIEDDGIGQFFEGEAWKVRRIVRTELAGMYGAAKQDSLERIAADEPLMRKTLYNPKDARTGADSAWLQSQIDAGRSNGANYVMRPKVEDPFVYVWKGHRRVFLAPPDRPNDRSILIPYHPSWD